MKTTVIPFALLSILIALPAGASPGHARVLDVDRLVASAEPGGVRIQLDLDDRTRLRRLNRSGLDPGLAIDFGRRTEVVDLTDRMDVLVRTRRAPHSISVRLIDQSPQQRHDLLLLALGGIAVESVKLPVVTTTMTTTPRPARHSWYNHEPVIDACRAAFPSHQRNACRQAVAEARQSPVALIQTCDRAFYGADETLQCLLIGVRTPAAHSTITACDAAFYSPADTLQCVRSAQTASRHIGADIAACDAAFYSPAATLTCIGNAAQQSASMSLAIEQCDATFYSEADEAECVARIAAAPSVPAALDILTHCDAKKRTDDKEMRCLEKKLGRRVAHRG